MLIISNKPGQLGNRLFVYANFIAYSMEHGVKILNPAFDEYAPYFKGTKGLKIATYPIPEKKNHSNHSGWFKTYNLLARITNRLGLDNSLVRSTFLDWGEKWDLEEKKLPDAKFHFIQGWQYRAHNLILKYHSEITKLFELEEPYKSNLEQYIQKLDKRKVRIGIHIRHGDYKNFEGGKYYYTFDQYANVMHQIVNHLGENIQFVICTNSTLENESFREFNILPGPGHFVEDMYALSQCDYIAGPPSTFSLWASYYGEVPCYQISDPNANFKMSDFTTFSNKKHA